MFIASVSVSNRSISAPMSIDDSEKRMRGGERGRERGRGGEKRGREEERGGEKRERRREGERGERKRRKEYIGLS